MKLDIDRKVWIKITRNASIQLAVNEVIKSDFDKRVRDSIKNQIENDLHRTGLFFCTTFMQIKLRKLLYAFSIIRTDIGYCQGLNIIGAIVLNVMDGNEVESLNVMVYLITDILPSSYFNETLLGLKADLSAFNSILYIALPSFAVHLKKLQGNTEPPITDMLTTSWFLTLFATSLPYTWVLRIWDLLFLEGSDVLLRCALSIWHFFESRILTFKSLEDFYAKLEDVTKEIQNGQFATLECFLKRVQSFAYIDIHSIRKSICNNYNINLKYYKRCNSVENNFLAVNNNFAKNQVKMLIKNKLFSKSAIPDDLVTDKTLQNRRQKIHFLKCSMLVINELQNSLSDMILYKFPFTFGISTNLTSCDIIDTKFDLRKQIEENSQIINKFVKSSNHLDLLNLIEENKEILCTLSDTYNLQKQNLLDKLNYCNLLLS